MPRCEDYPCCGHGPPPLGDGGGCPRVVESGTEACPECKEGLYEAPGEEWHATPCQNCDGTGHVTREVTQWQCVDCGVWFEPSTSSLCPDCYSKPPEDYGDPYDSRHPDFNEDMD